CRRAMEDAAVLLLFDRDAPEKLDVSDEQPPAARSDLHMLVAQAAKERTEAEFHHLLESGGLTLDQVLPAGMGLSVLVARPAA
ncbi:MAG: hypothetical protein KIT18_13935, partial [Burkholderiales bacterium]|nr:hypothetical protein [Burkholderiales bacterium]